ncbi:MAG: TonB-dependent receptor plug domain-containing protein [Polyangiales bacterium]
MLGSWRFAGALLLSTAIARVASAADLVPPRVVSVPEVTYPEGETLPSVRVVVSLVLDDHGHVESATEVRRVPEDAPDAFVERALEIVRGIVFKPATRDGVPIRSKIEYTVELTKPAPPAPKPTEPAKPKAVAPPATPVEPAKPEEPISVDVGGDRYLTRHHGLSDFHYEIGAQHKVPRLNATELLKLAPGILLTNEGGEGHPEQVFMRGFDAREGQDIEFTVGDVPINDAGNLHGNGVADTHFIIPELVLGLRVLEGPFAPQQGNFAVAGSADYELGLDRRGLTAKYQIGSFGSQRLLFLFGPPGHTLGTFGGVELYQTDGYGTPGSRPARRGTAMGQWEHDLGSSTLRITGTAYATSYKTAGVIRQDDYKAGLIGFYDRYDPNQGGESSRYSIALDWFGRKDNFDYRNLVYVIARDFRLRENFTGFLLDVQEPAQTLHSQRGDLLDLWYGGTTIGTRGSVRFRAPEFKLPQELELGYSARFDRTHSTQYRIENATQAPYHLENDLDSTLGDLGLWADASLRPFKWLTFRGGLRADLFTYDVLDNCAVNQVSHAAKTRPPLDQSCLNQENFGAYREPVERRTTSSTAVLPRATVLFNPIPAITISASYGDGVRSIDPVYITQDKATPFARVRSYEGGVGYARVFDKVALTARSIFFQTKVDQDLVFSQTEGRNTLANGTTRTGWVGAVRAIGPFFDEAANVTLVRSTFDDSHDLIPYVPDLVVRSDTVFFGKLPIEIDSRKLIGSLAFGTSWVGHRALPYGQRSDALFVVDASAALRWRGYEVSFGATNLFDRKYRLGEYNYASDFSPFTHSTADGSRPLPTLVPSRHFTAGAPRAIFVSLSVTFGDPEDQ